MTKNRHVSISPPRIDAVQDVGENRKGPNDREGRGRSEWEAKQGHTMSCLKGRGREWPCSVRRGLLLQVLGDLLRDGPAVHGIAFQVDRPVRSPPAHVKVMGHHRRAGGELVKKDGAELLVDRGEQIQRHHRRLADVGLEEVPLPELDEIGHAGLLGVLAGLLDEVGVDLNADPLRPVLPRCADYDASVSAPEIVDDIRFVHVGQLQHAVDDRLGRRHVGHVRLLFGRHLEARNRRVRSGVRLLGVSGSNPAAQQEAEGEQSERKGS